MASHKGPAIVATALFAILFSVARWVDVPRTGYGIKSDEATYVAMALSAAYDWNLSYERRDLERFAGLYHQGPEGIFLKSGQRLRVTLRAPFPFVHVTRRPDTRSDRLYFGKAFIYPLFAAPFVRLWGLNGLLIFHVVLLGAVAVCGYLFLSSQSSPLAAAAFTTAFFGAAALPVYGVFLMPEIFNIALVFVAYFLWAYKEVCPAVVSGFSRTFNRAFSRPWTDIAAAVLLGMATYSKPIPAAFLVAPLVLYAWWQRRWLRGFAIGAVSVVVCAAFFGLTAAVSGDWNYQGGVDRKTVYSRPDGPDFPFETADATWDRFASQVVTDGTAAAGVLTDPSAPQWFARNIVYFLFGRHFGFVPYYFPGVVAILWWVFSPARRQTWRLLTFAAFAVSAVALLLVLPFTWSGGGGPPGNRYALSAYPILFFLLPPSVSAAPGVIAWLIGALFTARMLVNPFAAAKFTWELYERGPARRLPVELSMSQDLPVMLAQPLRARITYGHDPFVLLYFLDQNAWPPEPPGMWISGAGRAEIILRAEQPIRGISVEAESPIRTTLTVSLGGEPVRRDLTPGTVVTFDVPAPRRVLGRYGDSVYLLSTHSTDGFVPAVANPPSIDYRNLGALLRFRAVLAASPTLNQLR